MVDLVPLPTTQDEEARLLAAILYDPNGYAEVAARLRPEHFSIPLFAEMYQVIGEAVAADKPAPVAIGRRFRDDPAYVALGGWPYWLKLMAQPLAQFGTNYADHLIDMAQRRAMMAQMLEALGDLNSPLRSAAASLADSMFNIATAGEDNTKTYTFSEAFDRACERMDRLARNEIPPGVMVDHLTDWNDITGGMQGGEFILLGGRPSMGKTALSLGVGLRAAMAGHGVLYISREMGIDQLMVRMIADLVYETGGTATFDQIRKGKVPPEERELIADIGRQVKNLPMEIIDPETLSAGEIGPLIRKSRPSFENRGKKLGLVVIDYLGLVDPPPGRATREQEVSAISKAIKMAARSNDVPVLVLAQLNRGVEQREDKHPQLSDLRDSGSLEQDADLVVFVYRDEYYLSRIDPDSLPEAKRETWRQDMARERNRIDIYSAKARQGELVRRKAHFFGARQAVRNSDYYQNGGR